MKKFIDDLNYFNSHLLNHQTRNRFSSKIIHQSFFKIIEIITTKYCAKKVMATINDLLLSRTICYVTRPNPVISSYFPASLSSQGK